MTPTAKLIILVCQGAIQQPLAAQLAEQIDASTIPREVVVAVMWRESRCKVAARSRTRDYGIMQLHVSKSCLPAYRGRERLLLDPLTNMRLALKAMAYWRAYHRRCKGPHHWIGHYNQGRHVQDERYGDAVMAHAGGIAR